MSFLLGFVLSFGRGIGNWLSRRSLGEILCIILVSALFMDHLALLVCHRHTRKVEHQLAETINLRVKDRAAYINAQVNAAARNKAQVAQIKQSQQEITDAAIARLHNRLELVSDELRREQSAAHSSPASGTGTSEPSATPCRAFDPAWMCVSPSDVLRAAQNEERHDELIDWVIAQSKVNTKN